MFANKQGKKKITKPIYPSDVVPKERLSKAYKESYPQSLMNYEIIRDKVQSPMQSKPTPQVAETKQPGLKKKLINF